MKNIYLTCITTILIIFTFLGCAKEVNYDEYYRANKAAEKAHEQLILKVESHEELHHLV